MSILNYHHFPIYSIMILFLGAFLTVVFGHKKALRNIFALLAVSVSLACMIALVKPVMLDGEIISYWMGGRGIAGGYAIGISLEVDALSLFFGLLISTAVFVSCVYSIQYMSHDDNPGQY